MEPNLLECLDCRTKFLDSETHMCRSDVKKRFSSDLGKDNKHPEKPNEEISYVQQICTPESHGAICNKNFVSSPDIPAANGDSRNLSFTYGQKSEYRIEEPLLQNSSEVCDNNAEISNEKLACSPNIPAANEESGNYSFAYGQKFEDNGEKVQNQSSSAEPSKVCDDNCQEFPNNGKPDVSGTHEEPVAGPSSLDIPSHWHPVDKCYVCSVCGKKFRDQLNFVNHHRVHTKEKTFPCDKYEKRFTRKSHLQYHLGTHTGEPVAELSSLDVDSCWQSVDKCYECPACRKTFSYKSKFVIHYRVHTKEKPFACEYCKKRYAQNKNLQHHLGTHTDKPIAGLSGLAIDSCWKSVDKCYECPTCWKTFSCKSKFVIHYRFHTKDRPFACEYCKKTFTQKKNLKVHLLAHAAEKPYKCSICGRDFVNKGSLYTHYKTEHQRK